MKNASLINKLEDDVTVDDQDIANSINQMPCHLGSCIIAHSNRLLNQVFHGIDGFQSNNTYYVDTDSAQSQKKPLVQVD